MDHCSLNFEPLVSFAFEQQEEEDRGGKPNNANGFCCIREACQDDKNTIFKNLQLIESAYACLTNSTAIAMGVPNH